jgi:hypothetical protein
MFSYQPLEIDESYGRTCDGSLDPHQIMRDLARVGTDYANLKHAFKTLEKTQKPVLSKLTNDARRDDPDLSRREAEDIATASEIFTEHLHKMQQAELQKDLAYAQLEALRAFIEALRSHEATRRSEMTGFRR